MGFGWICLYQLGHFYKKRLILSLAERASEPVTQDIEHWKLFIKAEDASVPVAWDIEHQNLNIYFHDLILNVNEYDDIIGGLINLWNHKNLLFQLGSFCIFVVGLIFLIFIDVQRAFDCVVDFERGGGEAVTRTNF